MAKTPRLYAIGRHLGDRRFGTSIDLSDLNFHQSGLIIGGGGCSRCRGKLRDCLAAPRMLYLLSIIWAQSDIPFQLDLPVMR